MCWACSDAATLIQASCSLVVPNSCMCRLAGERVVAHRAGDADLLEAGLRGVARCGPVPPGRWPPVRGRPASVMSATRHLPAAMAAAAWPTWRRYELPPVSVLST